MVVATDRGPPPLWYTMATDNPTGLRHLGQTRAQLSVAIGIWRSVHPAAPMGVEGPGGFVNAWCNETTQLLVL